MQDLARSADGKYSVPGEPVNRKLKTRIEN